MGTRNLHLKRSSRGPLGLGWLDSLRNADLQHKARALLAPRHRPIRGAIARDSPHPVAPRWRRPPSHLAEPQEATAQSSWIQKRASCTRDPFPNSTSTPRKAGLLCSCHAIDSAPRAPQLLALPTLS